MKRRTLLAATGTAAASGLLVPLLPGTARATTVTVQPGAAWGTWEGWGTSLAWWANVMGEDESLADLFFTTDTVTVLGTPLPGLGMNLARYNLGACSWNTYNGESMVVSPNMQPFKQIEGYWQDWASEDPTSSSWVWSADARQRAMMTMAHERGARIELFSNSPMWWMCLNHNPAGANNSAEDNLQPWNYRQFAVYLAEVARQSPERWGVPFVSVEAFNEGTSDYWGATGRQEGCHFDVSTQEEVLAHLRTELDRRGLSGTAIAASDETSYDAALSTWRAYSQASRDRVDRVNVHGYQGSSGPRDTLRQEVRAAGKGLWNSEYGDSDGTGVSMVRNLLLDLRLLRPDAWQFWQVLDESPGWAAISFDPGAGRLLQVQRKFSFLAQFTRHIRPGMRMIDTGVDGVVAAHDEAGRRLVVVAANLGSGTQELTVDLSAFGTLPSDGSGVAHRVTDTGDARYAPRTDVQLSGGRFTTQLGATSLHTFEVAGVAR
ncbi:glycoside hydrolase [Streptomyces sp. 4N509B]|uniref:glycoside hydrolase n=1 Tax=Streptomyces sp. 4N509B TaxID=3457413 RepID=UPI003FD36627